MKKIISRLLLFFLLITGCKNENTLSDEKNVSVKTPVHITTIENTNISEKINLNAISLYQKKNTVKAISNGYVEKVFKSIGDNTSIGNPLFSIKTKEAEALSKLNIQDSLFNFKGLLTILSPSSGIISEITKQTNDYVTDGDQLALIADKSSFVFLLNVPFELNKYIIIGSNCKILLPDSTTINGTIMNKLLGIDPTSQTQSYIVKPQTTLTLPENLIAIVQINKNNRQNTQVIDKSAVLADENFENFWVMMLVNDSTAVKININKGISTDNKIEILSPHFNKSDKIINSGNYGLPDTAYIKMIKE